MINLLLHIFYVLYVRILLFLLIPFNSISVLPSVNLQYDVTLYYRMLDKATGEQWHKDFQGFMHDARENGSEDEFSAQQAIYSKVGWLP